MCSAESLFSGWRLPEIATVFDLTCEMLQDYHLYHDSVNNKVLLSSNRQKQALFDKYIISVLASKFIFGGATHDSIFKSLFKQCGLYFES